MKNIKLVEKNGLVTLGMQVPGGVVITNLTINSESQPSITTIFVGKIPEASLENASITSVFVPGVKIEGKELVPIDKL